MKKYNNFLGLAPIVLLAVLTMGLGVTNAFAQEEAKTADVLADALRYYNEGNFEKGISISKTLFERADLTPQDSIAVYEVLGILTYAKGDDYHKQSFSYLNKISGIGPCIVHLPREMWQSELRDKWYEILKAKESLTCPEEAKSNIKTIAIMEFDNFSIGKYQQELGPIGKGLADWFEHDFGKISSMKVIERDKINYVLREFDLLKSGAVDKSTAARAGKILGAKYMVFGSFTQLNDKSTRMVVRVVSVETSEIIASVDKEARPQYSKLEKELVEELAKKLDITLSDDIKALIKEGGTESLDATTLYSKGLDYMDKYDYKNAYEFFKKAYDLDHNFVEAKRKMEIYRPLAS